jgi:hypothetical protein
VGTNEGLPVHTDWNFWKHSEAYPKIQGRICLANCPMGGGALAPSVSALLHNTIVATEDVHCQYRQAKCTWLSHLSDDEGDAPTLAVRQSIKGGMCPICLDDLDEVAQLMFCDTCGNAAHTASGDWVTG